MRKCLILMVSIALLLSLTACGAKTAQSHSVDVPKSLQNKESTSTDKMANLNGLTEIEKAVLTDLESTVAALKAEYDKLVTNIDAYDKYLKNADRVAEFYDRVNENAKLLCIRMREYSLDYAEAIMAFDNPNDDKYKDFKELYDCIYDDAGSEIYDEIYDGILDDIYKDFYDGILEDAYDNGIAYDEWSNARSREYDWWSDTRSDVYDEWSDFRSDVYDFWSDMRSELWDDDIERANDKIKKFKEDIEKIKNKDKAVSTESKPETELATQSKESTTSESNSGAASQLVEGMRPEFKEAMDSYETFYNEYCDFMKKYADNPTDITLLTKYAELVSKAAVMSEKFEAWKNDGLNNTELKYYLDVNNRITQKFLEVSR